MSTQSVKGLYIMVLALVEHPTIMLFGTGEIESNRFATVRQGIRGTSTDRPLSAHLIELDDDMVDLVSGDCGNDRRWS